MKQPKSKLKENYYWECSPFYDSLPDEIEVIENQEEFILSKTMTNKEILEENKIVPYTLEQAVGVLLGIIPNLKNDYKVRIVYFKDNDVLYRFYACRYGGGELRVSVRKVSDSAEWRAGRGAVFSTEPLNSSPLTLSPSETLSLHPTNTEIQNAIAILKQAKGYKVYQIKEIEL